MKNKKIKIGIIIICICSLIIRYTEFYIYVSWQIIKAFDIMMGPFVETVPLHFKDVDQTIYITSDSWGLFDAHTRIYVSDKENVIPDDDSFVFNNRTSLYYKIQSPDSLFIYLPSDDASEEWNIEKRLRKIKIKITKYRDEYSERKKYDEKYKEMGLEKFSRSF